MKPKEITPKTGFVTRLFIAVVVIAAGISWTGTASLNERVASVHYLLLFLTALFSFATPYVLFPDSNSRMIQLANYSGPLLRSYLRSRWNGMIWPLLLLILVMMTADVVSITCFLTEKLLTLTAALLYLTAISLFSIQRYLHSGEKSRYWKESERGQHLRKAAADLFKYPLDPGSIPTLINTILVLTAGSATLLIGFVLNQALGSYAELIWITLMTAGTVLYAAAGSDHLLRSYYSGNAFFAEFFGSNLKGSDTREESREVHQLWWVPEVLKPHVWQFLIQLDRQIPAGRAVAAGHLLIWFAAYQRPDAASLLLLWALFALMHHLFLIFTFREEMSPGWLHRWIAHPFIWYASRVWLQLRWILPMSVSMNLQLFIFGMPTFRAQLIILLIYLTGALLIPLYGIRRKVNFDSKP